MRRLILAFTVTAVLVTGSAALGAPTCQDENGITAKCGTPGAMPVGWAPSPQQLLERQMARPKYPSMAELLELVCVIGVFFGLMALMPEFEGSRDGRWDRQEDDDEERG
jgi:hypothetical protein